MLDPRWLRFEVGDSPIDCARSWDLALFRRSPISKITSLRTQGYPLGWSTHSRLSAIPKIKLCPPPRGTRGTPCYPRRMGLIQPRTTWKTPEHAPQIYFDLFPTIVTFPDSPASTPYSKTRFILAAPPTPYVYVFKDGFQGVEATVFAEYDPDAHLRRHPRGLRPDPHGPSPNPRAHVHPPRCELRLRLRPQGLPPVHQPQPHRSPHPPRPARGVPDHPPRRALRPPPPEPATWG